MVIKRHVLMFGEASRLHFISHAFSLCRCPAAVSFISNNYTGSELTAFITLTANLLEESGLQLLCVWVCMCVYVWWTNPPQLTECCKEHYLQAAATFIH